MPHFEFRLPTIPDIHEYINALGQGRKIVMDERSRRIKLAEFPEEGADYVRAAFEWMAAARVKTEKAAAG